MKYFSIFFLSLALQVNAQVASDLKSAYYFSGNSNDAVGENHLNMHGNVSLTSDRFGNEDCAYFFPFVSLEDNDNTMAGDTSAYLYLLNPDDEFSIDNESGWSLSLWYKGGTSNLGDLEHIFMRNFNPTYNTDCYQISLYDLNTPLTTVFIQNDENNYIWAEQNTANLDSTVWHHAVLVVDNLNQILFYVDNVLQGTIENAEINDICNSPIYIGYDFYGKVDDIIYYKSVLNEDQIDSLFTAESSCAGFTGIKEEVEKELEFELYPNPAKFEFSIKLQDNWQGSVISISNMLGEKMEQITPSSENIKLSTENWPSGIYFVHIQNELNKSSTTKKLVIKN